MRPGVIRYFMVHSVQIEGNQIFHAFAVVNWPRPSEQDFGYGNPFSVWLKNFEEAGPSAGPSFWTKVFNCISYLQENSSLSHLENS